MRALVTLMTLFSLNSCSQKPTVIAPSSVIPQEPEAVPAEPEPLDYAETFLIPKNSSSYAELLKVGFTPKEINQLQESSREVHPLNRIRANTPFTVWWESESKLETRKLEIQLTQGQVLRFALDTDDWTPELVELPVEKISRTFSGIVKSSLWDSASSAGLEPRLIPEFAEIFGWQIDFSREVRHGDSWRLVVEEHLIDGKSVGWGPILAAQYHTHAGELYTGIRYPQDAELASYYQEDGTNLRRMFLKSPIKFGRISSRFSNRRFHPILKRNRPHLGVDYAAPTGTPIRSVGDGRVVYVGRNGGSGKMIKIRHNSIYTTAYLHLSRFAKGLRKGSTVSQGQTIGYVGQTGLATGPHLHFSFFKRGHYIDPLAVKFPSADPIADEQHDEFSSLADQILKVLPDWQSVSNIAEERADEGLNTSL